MTTPITTGLQSIVHPVTDVERARATYAALLGEPHTDTPYYVGFNVGGMEVGLNPHGAAQGLTAPVGMWSVPDVEAALVALEEAGARRVADPQEVGGGTTIAYALDADGNPIGLIHAEWQQ